MTAKCTFHAETDSTHCILDSDGHPTMPVCDPCAAEARGAGLHVRQHHGYLWGLPVFHEDDDGVMESAVIFDREN